MGILKHLGWTLCLVGTAHSQLIPQPTSRTIPTAPPLEEKPSAIEGLLTPEQILPEGFTFRSDRFEGDITGLLSGDAFELTPVGNVRMTTDRNDTIDSDRAKLNFAADAQSVVTFSQNVRMRSSNGIEIFADSATLNEGTKSILFEGNISAYQGSALHRGESVIYYYKSQRIVTSALRTSFPPILLEAGSFRAIESAEGTYYKGQNTGVTTHDVSKPNFWLRGEEVTVIPDNRVRFRNVKLYAGDTPILWLPGLTQKFDGKFNYRPTPGARSNWGPFLLNAYTQDLGGPRNPETGILDDPTFEATWNVDLYGERGLGLGADLESNQWRDNPNLGGLSLYHIYDQDPSEQRSAEPRLDFNDRNRFRLQLQQRANVDLLPGATGHADVNITLLSDRFFLEDFRPGDFATDFQPDNTVSLSQSWQDSHLLTAWARLRVNDFFQSDQRLPEIALDSIRRPLFGSPILHEGQSTVGLYREDIADFTEDQLRAESANPLTSAPRQVEISDLLAEAGFARFHTYQEISLPVRLDNGLHITPRLGAGHTSYQNIRGPLDSEERNLLHASIDASLKFTKRYPEWFSERWGLDSALHVVQPYATATVLRADSIDDAFRPIDRLTASTRPRALTPGRFAAVDELQDWEILRLGVNNRILTKRDSESHQWLSVNSFVDIFGEDPEFDRTISNLYTDVHWSPLPWLDLTVETQVPLFSDDGFTEVATGLIFMPTENTEVSIRHRYLESHPILQDSNRLEVRANHRINEEWGIGSTHRWEFADDTLEFQQYSLHRNLDSWVFTLGVFARDNLNQDEFGALVGFTLTEFPALRLPLRLDN